MKKIFTLLVAFVCLTFIASAQLTQSCYNQNFESAPSGWSYSQGASEGAYNNPANNCAVGRGIITPGVGGNNPANLFSPNFTSTGVVVMQISFDIFRLNSNLSCNTWSNYGCPTSIDIFYYVGATKYIGIKDLVLPVNGPGFSPNVSCSFNTGANLPAGTVYRLEIAFKPKSGIGNCGQPGTKYVIDNFQRCEITCIGCTLDAQDDNFCDDANDPLTVTGNLALNDSKYAGANVTYTLANGPFGNGSSTTGGATLVINPNGTFTLTRTDMSKSIFDFTYKIADATFSFSDLASAKVCFPSASIMPVVIRDFSAKRDGNMAKLTWNTATEVNSSMIEIEKLDGVSFTKTGSVRASNLVNGSSYNYSEKNTSSSATQYRLKFIERNGDVSYSEVRIVKGFGTVSTINVFPNPSNGASKVTISDISRTDQVQVLDAMGRIVLKLSPASNGSINTSSLQKGVYFIQVINQEGSDKRTSKLLIN